MYVGKKSLSDMRKFYFKARKDVFKDPQGGLKFDSKKLESMLKEIFGNKRMCDVEDNDPRYIGRCYVGMARMPASRNTFSKPPNSQTTKL